MCYRSSSEETWVKMKINIMYELIFEEIFEE